MASDQQGEELEVMLKQELAPELEIVKRLGRGSVASVYQAREPQLKRMVAVKVLSPELADDERARLRFEREAQASASLSHPNIVAVYRVGRLSNGLPYIVMQYVKGRTMAERLKAEGPLPRDEARRVLADVASALGAAHQKRIVHRDIRAGNVLHEEDSGRTLLADFGIAAILASAESGAEPRLTRTGEMVGDPSHMSPEQLKGEELSERSDVYALGLLGYELAAGRGPYDAKSKREQIEAHVRGEPRRLSELRPDADPLLEDLLLRCLAKEPEHRPNASDVAKRLSDTSGEVSTPGGLGTGAYPGFMSRLMERRIPQMIVPYIAACWVILEVASQLVENDVLPNEAYRLVLVAAVTGLPAVVTGAWFHGKRGRQKFTPIEYWVFGGLALIWLAVSAVILVGWL